MDVYARIATPDNNKCSTCSFYDDGDYDNFIVDPYCQLSGNKIKSQHKTAECLALPEALACGHHPDAIVGDLYQWCVKCEYDDKTKSRRGGTK